MIFPLNPLAKSHVASPLNHLKAISGSRILSQVGLQLQ